MSRFRREKQQRQVFALTQEGAPEQTAETLTKIKALQTQYVGNPGLFKVAIFHEQFCANALRAGAKKCSCSPEVKVLTVLSCWKCNNERAAIKERQRPLEELHRRANVPKRPLPASPESP